MTDDQRLIEVFFDVQRGLPRQGPGSDESTLRALALCRLPERPAILDIGCGPGMQTIALAEAAGAHVTAVDTNAEYLTELAQRASAAGLADRIEILNADMNDLPLRPATFDAVWSEGAAYIMGFASALASWRRFLKPGGAVVVSELVWLVPDPPAEVAAFFGSAYPAMTDIATNLATVRECGYEPVGHFTLPDRTWWEHYYTPLEAKLPTLRARYSGDEEALRVVKSAASEIEIRRRFPDAYGYEFFIARSRPN